MQSITFKGVYNFLLRSEIRRDSATGYLKNSCFFQADYFMDSEHLVKKLRTLKLTKENV